MNRLQLLRTSVSGRIPEVANLLEGEMAVNTTDADMYIRLGGQVYHINAASFLKQDSAHRLVSDAQIAAWSTTYQLPIASSTVLGGVKVGANIVQDVDGTIRLNEASATTTGVLTSTDWTTFNGKQDALGYTPVNKAGDTMTGSLTLSGDPTLALHAATMQYVDNGLNAKLDLAGGTMTGSLLLAGDPTAGLQAATKQYVDQGLSLLGGRLGAPVATLVDLTAVASGTLADRQLRLVENTGAIFRYDVQSTDVPDGDGVLAPDDITPPAPGRWIKAQSATVAHNMLSSIQGGAPGEYLHLTNAEKNSYDAHLTDLGLHLTSAQNSLLDGISVTASEINYLTGITGNIQSQLDGLQTDLGYTPVNKAGDTMLGTLVLAGDPTAALHPVTKQYLEAYTVDCGTF